MRILICAVLGAAMFYLSQGVDAVWGLAWIAPLPLLWLAYDEASQAPRWPLFLAGLFAFRVSGQADLRLFLTTGMLGGFTTWSTFSLDVATLWQRGPPFAAFGYVGVSLVASLAGLAAMLIVMRRLA